MACGTGFVVALRWSGAATVLLAMTICFSRSSAAAEPADRYPVKPVRVIVGFPPGGPVDLQARVILPRLSEALRQPIVIDNRAGADGALGSELVAKSPPDGHTLLYGNAGHVTNQILHGNALPYDAIRDFAPAGLLTSSAFVLFAHPTLPAGNVAELISLAKAQPGKLSYGSAGNGSFAHLSGEYLKAAARIDLVHVPYKGAAPALNDVLGGQIPLAFLGPAPLLPHIRSGRIKALAVTSAKRISVLPRIPAIAEAGFPDFDVAAWYGFFAPARTSPAIITRLNRELRAILEMQDVRERLAALGVEPVGSTPEQHAAHIKSELARWTPVIKATGMRVD